MTCFPACTTESSDSLLRSCFQCLCMPVSKGRKAVKFKEIEMTLGCNVGHAANLDCSLDSSTDSTQGLV